MPRPSLATLAHPRSRRLPLALALAAALPALAQQAPPPDSGKVETITVTATKRPQLLQTTPIAVSVLGGGALEEGNLNNMATITAIVPTVNFRTNASNKDSSLFIRGVGTISTSPGVEPTVSMVIDGVVTARPGQATLDLVEVERIEILRGPQGTVFGKNASAGVINVITRAPGKTPGGYVDLSWFQGGERRVRLGAGGELSANTVRGSIAFMDAKYDGNVTNVFDGSKVNGYDRQGIRGRLDITPNRSTTITLIADRSKAIDTTPTGVPVSTTVRSYPSNNATNNPLFAAALAPVVPGPENRQINNDLKTRVQDTNAGVSAQVDYQLPAHQITGILARRTWKNTQVQDLDRLPQPYANSGLHKSDDLGDLDFTQTTAELRVSSTTKQFAEYVAGVFQFDGKNDETYRRDVTRCAASTATPLPSGLIPCSAGSTTKEFGLATYGVRAKSTAAFGETTLNFSERLRAIAGARYTLDELSYYHERTASATGVPGVGATRARVVGSTTEKAWSGRVGPQYDIDKATMAYATVSRGYKGPAYNVFFNMSPTQDNVLAPETSDSYEVGVKTELMDRRVRLNVAAFLTDYDGYQANVPDLLNGVIVTRLINAGKVRTKGVEVDLTARITPAFTVNAGLARILARVKNFTCPPGAALSCDINGKPLPFSPDWKANVRAKYTRGIGGGLTLEYGADYSWQSKVVFDLQQQPDSFQKSYGIFNASIALSSERGWRVSLIGKNLADTSYSTLVQNNPGPAITRYVPRDDKRYFGITGRYDF
ncbi:MAG: TonB-dependent receptor [Leptothrix sp. (in: Bacteria)]|nr:TonB-dependent receptor [Leptothrix sp. (in: b-proteobacteria)]